MCAMYNTQDRDLQRRQIEQKMDRVRQELDRMRVTAAAAKIADVERQYKALVGVFADKTIPRDFVKEQTDLAKQIVQNTAARACDIALGAAREAAMVKNDKEKNKQITLAKELLKKAIEFGAETTIADIVQKKIELISETGGHLNAGPTRAKPVETQPKMANFAKEERRAHKRFAAPALTIQVGETKCSAVNWSVGGLLIKGLPGRLPPGYELQLEYGLESGGPKHAATVRVVRVEESEDGNLLGVRFLRSTRAGFEFFQNLLRINSERNL